MLSVHHVRQISRPPERNQLTDIHDCWDAYSDAWHGEFGFTTEPELEAYICDMLRARLAEGYSVRQLATAAENLFTSSWHIQNNLISPVYCWRDGEAVDGFQIDWSTPVPNMGPNRARGRRTR